MIILPTSHRDLPDYRQSIDNASTIDGNRDFFFVSRWFPIELMGIKIRNLTVKDFLVLHAEKNRILTEQFTFSDSVKFLYILRYKPTESILLRTIREYLLGKKIIKYIQKNYPKEDIETKVQEIVSNYWDNLLNDLPSRNIPVDNDQPKVSVATTYNGYVWASMICAFLNNYNMTESEIMDLPVQVFFEYYQCLVSLKNPDHVRKGRVDYVEYLYQIRFTKLKNILEGKK